MIISIRNYILHLKFNANFIHEKTIVLISKTGKGFILKEYIQCSLNNECYCMVSAHDDHYFQTIPEPCVNLYERPHFIIYGAFPMTLGSNVNIQVEKLDFFRENKLSSFITTDTNSEDIKVITDYKILKTTKENNIRPVVLTWCIN